MRNLKSFILITLTIPADELNFNQHADYFTVVCFYFFLDFSSLNIKSLKASLGPDRTKVSCLDPYITMQLATVLKKPKYRKYGD